MSPEPTRVDFASTDGVTVAAYRWEPRAEPCAVAQIPHGVGEYALRYPPLARTLSAAGLVVYAHDHRGQQYLLDHSGDVDAVVLSGTAAIDLLEPMMDP